MNEYEYIHIHSMCFREVYDRYSYHSFDYDYDYDFGDSTPLKIKI